MRNVKVLGTGCAKCIKLAENVEEAARQLSMEIEIEKVTDIQQIISYGVMMTPGLIIDGKLISAGRLLYVKELKELLS